MFIQSFLVTDTPNQTEAELLQYLQLWCEILNTYHTIHERVAPVVQFGLTGVHVVYDYKKIHTVRHKETLFLIVPKNQSKL